MIKHSAAKHQQKRGKMSFLGSHNDTSVIKYNRICMGKSVDNSFRKRLLTISKTK